MVDITFCSWFDYIKLTPDRRWSYNELSMNPNITWDIVVANPDKDWNNFALCRNPSITWVLNLQKGIVYAMHLSSTISLTIALFHLIWALLFGFECVGVLRLPPEW